MQKLLNKEGLLPSLFRIHKSVLIWRSKRFLASIDQVRTASSNVLHILQCIKKASMVLSSKDYQNISDLLQPIRDTIWQKVPHNRKTSHQLHGQITTYLALKPCWAWNSPSVTCGRPRVFQLICHNGTSCEIHPWSDSGIKCCVEAQHE